MIMLNMIRVIMILLLMCLLITYHVCQYIDNEDVSQLMGKGCISAAAAAAPQPVMTHLELFGAVSEITS